MDSPSHIRAVRDRCPHAPIIGLWKRTFPDSDVYITPQLDQAQAVAAAGADLIAIDCTLRPRPDGGSMAELIQAVRQTLGKPVMADIDTLEAAIAAVAAGADCVGTTLYGYTAATQQGSPPGFDLLSQLVERLSVPVICEGGIASPAMAQAAIALGAHAVVVGTAITGIDLLTQRYVQALS
jgi:N-acylglucosamine-6-phosphate 2-epimerase